MWKKSKLAEMTTVPQTDMTLLVGCCGTDCKRFALLPLPQKIGVNLRKGWTAYFDELRRQGFVATITSIRGGQPSTHALLCFACAATAGLLPGAGTDLPPAEG